MGNEEFSAVMFYSGFVLLRPEILGRRKRSFEREGVLIRKQREEKTIGRIWKE